MVQVSVREVTFSSGALTLEGVLHVPTKTPAAVAVVCHPHPQYGGDMENNVVHAACEALVQQGFAALRFNFRGVGRSDGAFDQGQGERDDVRAAIAHLATLPEIDEKRVGLIGYSFGAMMAAEVANGSLRALALISPPVGFGDLRVAWGCPAFVTAGDQDQLAPADRVRVIGDAPGVETNIVAGADHSWWGYEPDLGESLGDFFARHFR